MATTIAGIVYPFTEPVQPESLEWAKREWVRCARSSEYFIHNYCTTYDATAKGWLWFKLWPAQAAVLKAFGQHQLVSILKARQLGLTWLAIAYALWMMLFRSEATVLLFSRRDDESIHLLQERLTKMYKRLPTFLKSKSIVVESAHKLQLSNGSTAMAFPTTGGDSYTASLVIVDEADLIKNFERLMGSVKPTIDAGGQMILITRPDKSKPASYFKRLFRAALKQANGWFPIFLPWQARPGRDEGWYERQRAESLENHGSLDYLHEQYASTVEEALAPASEGKRFKSAFIRKVYKPRPVMKITPRKFIDRPGFTFYQARMPGVEYFIGGDPAEGNPTSDDSAFTVLRLDNGEEVCSFADKLEPGEFAGLMNDVAEYYNMASILPERNNHGHAVILWLNQHGHTWPMLGHDGRHGFLSSQLGKSVMYAICADQIRNGEVIIHNQLTYLQMCSIEGTTLRAPEGEHDDRSDSFALACCARYIHLRGWEALVAAMSGSESKVTG